MENQNDRQERHGPTKLSLSGRAAFFDQELSGCIDWFYRRSRKTRMLAFQLRIWATILSAATTVMLGLQGGFFETNKSIVLNIALTVSSVVTVFGAIESFFDFRGLWIRYTETRTRLLRLRAKLRFLASGENPIDDETLVGLFETYQGTLTETDDAWLQMRSDSGGRSGSPQEAGK